MRTPGGRSRFAPADVMRKASRGSRSHVVERRKKTAAQWAAGATRACKPGSVLTAIYLAPRSLMGSSRLLEAVGQTYRFSTALLRGRVYIVEPMLPWAGQAMSLPFHLSCREAVVYLCCTCPEVTLGGRYPLPLPCGARTFLIWSLSASIRGCPARSREYCNL